MIGNELALDTSCRGVSDVLREDVGDILGDTSGVQVGSIVGNIVGASS